MFNLYGRLAKTEKVIKVQMSKNQQEHYAIVAVSQLSPCMHAKPDLFGRRILVLKLYVVCVALTHLQQCRFDD